MNNMNELIGEFKKIRQKKRIAMRHLEGETNTGGGSISKFEAGELNPGLSKFLIWCNAMGYDVVLRRKR